MSEKRTTNKQRIKETKKETGVAVESLWKITILPEAFVIAGGSEEFPALIFGWVVYSLSLDAKIMVSKNCPINDEHVVIIFVTP